MSSHRGLRPGVGVVLCIGTGCAAAVLSDADSVGRRRISSGASEVRREVLLRALSKRLLSPSRGSSSPEAQQQQQQQHQQEETQRSPTDLQHPHAAELTTAVSVSSAAEPESISKRFYVVTGPDADLTSLARERLSRALLSGDNNRVSQREPHTMPLPARLVVPYDCVLGTGRFSLLVEQQLLQDSPLEDVCGASSRVGGRLGVEGDRRPQQQQQQQQHLNSHDNNVTDNVAGDEVLSKQGPDARAPPTSRTLITNWESFLLRATLPFMDAEQLDQAALWALENALSRPTAPPAAAAAVAAAATAAGQPHTTTTASGKGKELSADVSRSTAQVASRGETTTVGNHEHGGETHAGHRYSDNNHDHDPARGGEREEEEDSSSGSFSDGAVADFGEGGEGDAAPKTADFAFAETESEVESDTQSETDSRTESGTESETGLPSVSSKTQTQVHGIDRRSFVLEIAWSAREHDGEGTPHGHETGGASTGQEGNSGNTNSSTSSSSNIHSSRTLCGELARWGWRLAARGLGHAVVSSPNPWVLAEVQRALRTEGKGPIPGLSGEPGTGSSDGGGVKDEGDASAIEVTVVRVALPSAAERQQAVVSVARELGVNDHLSELDVSKLAEITGGRRAVLLDALGRVRGSSTVAEACQAVVDDQALALASSWGLLPRDSSLGEAEEVAASYLPPSGTVPEAQATRSHTSIARGVSIGTGGGAVCGGGKGREEWAPLWEALGVLSMPSVSIGAGPTSAPTPPQGCLLPAQLSDECQVDAEALLVLMQAGWLEISPSAPPGSGTALEDPEFHAEGDSFSPSPPVDGLFFPRHHRCPPVTVHAENVPLASLARLDRSFVGAPPLRLAAFRRLLDSSKPWATASGLREFGAVCGEGGGGGGGGGGGSGRGGGGGGGRLFEAPRGQAAIREGVAAEEADVSGAWRGGEQQEEEESSSRSGGVGSVDGFRDRELAQAGCLIEASMLARVLGREEAKLSEDRAALSSHWAELGTARRGLERDGKRDASDGEWAEVQLELIRQERAVVARANEMRARRARLDVMRSEILELEHSANPLLPPSLLLPSLPPPPPPPPSVTPTSPPGNFRDFSREHNDHQDQHQKHSASTASGRVGVDRGWVSTAVEEAVIGDAEKGVLLVPLRKGFEKEQAAGVAGLGEGRARGKPVKVDDGVGGGGSDSGKGRWRLARGFWRWMRGY